MTQENPPALDFQLALIASAGNEQLAHKLLTLFVAQLPAYHSDIKEFLGSNNTARLQNRIHKLNSASQYIGTPLLRQLVSELDGQIESLSKKSYTELVIKINRVLDLIKQIKTEEKYSD